ncbi:MAG TPA: bifunctional phosphoglucose/phosphomannose isomerase [Candidatus Portnoybacteria bacterium]|nr:bifunctional phosphoglucose/phosphomannose isomerase [Candidatus Portnoybacteria bacterium]
MEAIDKSNFRDIILNSVNQLTADLEFFNQLQLARRPFNKVIFCGMGGSAFIGDFLVYFKKQNYIPLSLNLPIVAHRSYDLPPETDDDSLIICSSYSGNTEEAISSFQKAKQMGLEITGITCGGQLADLFQRNKTPWVKIPRNDLPPRCSLGYQLAALIKILMAYGLLPASAQNELVSLAENLKPENLESEAKNLSATLLNKIPVIYVSDNNQTLARLWKIKFNENAKVPSFYNSFPELNHNEMVGWTKMAGLFSFLFLSDVNDLPPIKKRMDLTAELLKRNGAAVSFVKLGGAGALAKIFWASVFGDWLSYYLALNLGIDPTPVQMVEEFKKMLK